MVKLGKSVIFDHTISLFDLSPISPFYLVIPEFEACICIYPFSAKLFHFKMSVAGRTCLGILV